jgi:hypothetical protein
LNAEKSNTKRCSEKRKSSHEIIQFVKRRLQSELKSIEYHYEDDVDNPPLEMRPLNL